MCVMDDEDDRRLLDILGDVDALNDYLHGNNSKSIEEDDVTNAAYGSDGSFFGSDAVGPKDGSSSMGDFCEDSAGAGLQLSSSLSFIEDELGTGNSPGGMDLGEDQPFDILQKSLLEADITEQTLAQEALLESQPAPTLVQAPVSFPSQLVPGSYGAAAVSTAPAAFPTSQFLQGVSQLPNGSTQHIQVLGSFGSGGGVMTLSSLERTPQIVLRPGAPVAAAGAPAGGQVFAPNQAQVGQSSLPFKNIPLQNIIIQRGPAGSQALVRPIQPKPLQAGAQTVYSLGLQPSPSTMASVVNANAAPGGQYTANGSIVVQPPLEQKQVPANLPPGQFLLPGSLAITPSTSLHNGPAACSANALITSQNTVQIVAGQNFSGPAGGQLVLNQGVVSGSPVAGSVTQTWTGVSCNSSSPALTQTQLGGIHVMKTMTAESAPGSQVCSQQRLGPAPLTKAGLVLQQLRKDHGAVHAPDRRRFVSADDALQRLLPFHVFQGASHLHEEFSQVDEEFEIVATQVLNRTQAMVNKYRRLLMVEAERSSPSSEMVMIDRTFNQEERNNLTQDKRMVLVDPDTFLEDFCCGVKSKRFQEPLPSQSGCSRNQSHRGSTEPAHRTEPPPGCVDPGGGVDADPPQPHSENKSVLELKRSQQRYGAGGSADGSGSHGDAGAGQTHYHPQPPPQLPSPPHLDTDSALEAAVNSILEC
ncbi:BRD4-interacting chromatin-remodeling complex-associated protein-like isoform X3 [Betta splendens]|uniref:BRD4-interacting chromatin-remodeling complex-associated protein-like isoform X3 n=1 Tax=Betta splendens TaxID=158456 RepID=A0A6P7L6E5_BETSP|nr:BRD4-interacting chromatin-remodeling complex-associated protein-like isoform X3 [Betta splendens]